MTEYLHGVDRLNEISSFLAGKRLGLLTNHTGVDRNLIPTVDLLREKFDLCRLFSPEHGLYGAAQAGVHVSDSTDPRTGLPIFSLYDKEYAGALDGLGCLVFDMQDVGVRFYTYLYALSDAMKLCAEKGIPLVVLDRYDPLGLSVTEGTILDRRFASGVGKFPIPTRTGMTIGEYARYINRAEGIGCELTVLPCVMPHGYRGEGSVWVPPSPNMPTRQTASVYVGTCLFEGTNLSEGRGTTTPFEVFGAPWLDADLVLSLLNEKRFEGVLFRRCDFVPTFSKHQGVLCRGIQVHVTDPERVRTFRVGLHAVDLIRRTHPDFAFLGKDSFFIDKLLGSDALRREDFDPDAFTEAQKPALSRFEKESEWARLYER